MEVDFSASDNEESSVLNSNSISPVGEVVAQPESEDSSSSDSESSGSEFEDKPAKKGKGG
jgi:hypothetical protein